MKHLIRVLVSLVLLIVIISVYFWLPVDPAKHVTYGITWSDDYAQSLGLDPAKAFEEAVTDLNFSEVRIPAYWTSIEPEVGTFEFARLQQQLDLLAKNHKQAIVVIGYKQPRWPECWMPDWAKQMTASDRNRAQMNYVERTVQTFIDHPAIKAWQVENEPTFAFNFGVCAPPIDQSVVTSELALVKSIEAKRSQPRPVFTTHSGELSLWLDHAGEGNEAAISIYRMASSPNVGSIHYWFPPQFYKRKADLVRGLTGRVFVSEFQAEPWSDQSLLQTPIKDQVSGFSADDLKDNFSFANKTGFDEVLFWGAEWWLWMKDKQNHPEYWEAAKTFFVK